MDNNLYTRRAFVGIGVAAATSAAFGAAGCAGAPGASSASLQDAPEEAEATQEAGDATEAVQPASDIEAGSSQGKETSYMKSRDNPKFFEKVR